jgi:transcriptional regulator of acetoin/glycerol metabolism
LIAITAASVIDNISGGFMKMFCKAINKAKAARSLGIDQATLYRKIKRYNLAKDTP